MTEEKKNDIRVIAQSRDVNSKGWRKLVQFYDYAGVEKKLPIPCSSLAGDCRDVKAMLLDEGFKIEDEKELINYLKSETSNKYYLSVDKTGWYNQCFILPDTIIGNDNDEIYFPASSTDISYKVKGTVDDWKNNIGKYCNGNSRLVFAVSSAFAAALLYLLDEENVGFHFVGNSSCGKSTILRVACSVWGDQSYMKTWRATDNAIEGIANLRNDTLLVLDELGQIDPAKAGDVAYMLGNGQSKGRCNKDGSAKKISTWRLLYLSSGEKDLNDCENESKKKTKAGQLIRLINIPAVHNENSKGAFDCLHDKSDGKELAEYLSSVTKVYYGAVSRGFIEHLIKEGKDAIKEGFDNYKKQFNSDNLPEGADSQIQRGINKFALVAYAGELATANGFTGWHSEEAKKAAITCFNDWIKERGGVSNQEVHDLLQNVKLFFEQHSSSRFLDLSTDSSRAVNNMAGYKKEINESIEYWVFPEIFKKEICGGVRDAKKILLNKGWLKSIQPETRKIGKSCKRLYTILPKIWE